MYFSPRCMFLSYLQGFWDMIYNQMEKLDKNFDEMSTLEANNWQLPEPEKRKPLKRKPVQKVLGASNRIKPVVAGLPKPVSGVAAAKASSLRATIEAKRRALAAGGESQQEGATTALASKSPAQSNLQVTVANKNGKLKQITRRAFVNYFTHQEGGAGGGGIAFLWQEDKKSGN